MATKRFFHNKSSLSFSNTYRRALYGPQSDERPLQNAALAVFDFHSLICRSMCRDVLRCYMFTWSNRCWRFSNMRLTVAHAHALFGAVSLMGLT